MDEDGRVERVWTIREPKWKPSVPAFNQAIVDALQQWRYEPFKVGEETAAFCVTVTVTIELR